MNNKKNGIHSIDEYIANCPEKTQKVLKEIREIIKATAPTAQEKISYQIAAFELNGKNLIYFAGWKNHVSIYPIPSGTDTFKREISQYVDGKGTLKFPLDKPLPLKLIGKIVELHLAENLEQTGKKMES